MKILGTGLGLVAVGIVLAVVVTGLAGEVLVVAGAALILFTMIQAADGETSGRQSEIDARADEIRGRHQNPV
jgi:hypothetical protein